MVFFSASYFILSLHERSRPGVVRLTLNSLPFCCTVDVLYALELSPSVPELFVTNLSPREGYDDISDFEGQD